MKHRECRDRFMGLIGQYHARRVQDEGAACAVDDRTWADLDLDRVFARVDHTESTVGQQVLYHRLRSAQRALRLDAFDALANHLGADTQSRARVQIALRRLQDPAGYHLCTLGAEPFEVPRWYVVFPVLSLAMIAGLLLTPLSGLAILAVIVLGMVNIAVRLYLSGPAGLRLGIFRQIGPLIGAADAIARLHCPQASDIIAPLHGAVPRLQRLRFWSAWSGRPVADELTLTILEYVNLFLLLDANALYFAGREVQHCAGSLLATIEVVGEVDAALAVASFRSASNAWTRPEFQHTESAVSLSDLRHPLLDNAVPNSVELRPPNGLLLTGANMSGKSTFLRTVGVNVVLAQSINTCFATEYRAPMFFVNALMEHQDDLKAGRSYYLAEVQGAVDLVRASDADAPQLFLVDELFRGTNAIERISASTAVLEHLAQARRNRPQHVVLAATHDGELNALLEGLYVPWHFADRCDSEGLRFDYHLIPGPATSRNAIQLLEANGAPTELVSRARSLSDALENSEDLQAIRESH